MKTAGSSAGRAAVRWCVAIAVLVALLGIPGLMYRERIAAALGGASVDAVAGATLELPEQPSGEFLILLNAEKHPDTLADWEAFFLETPVDVIFEDLNCVVIEGDASAQSLAERYQARLAEHQMTLRKENGTLAVSRAQWAVFDVLIVSREMAEALDFSTVTTQPEVRVIALKGGTA